MRKLVDALANLVVWIVSKLAGGPERLQNQLKTLKGVLAKETAETKDMFETYNRYLHGEVTKKEMKKANKQLRDLMKTLGLGVLIVLPFAPITLPLVAKIAEKFGIKLFPSSMRP